jgi:hypothetical protein
VGKGALRAVPTIFNLGTMVGTLIGSRIRGPMALPTLRDYAIDV